MKRGFTLIELLAVIVILAIIALIATPTILNIIEDAREESNKRSIEMYASAIKNAVARHQLNGGDSVSGTFSPNGKSITNGNDLIIDLEYDNAEVLCTTIEIFENGNVYLDNCKINNQNVDYIYGGNKYQTETPSNTLIFKPIQSEPIKNYRIYGNSEGLGEVSGSNYIIPVEVRGKNLLTLPSIVPNLTGNTGVVVSCNFIKDIIISAKSDIVTTENKKIWRLKIDYKNGTSAYLMDNGENFVSTAFKASEENPIVSITYRSTYIESGSYYDIQVEEGKAATEYEPYVEPIKFNISLTSPLKENEYIDFKTQKVMKSDGTVKENITLPSITTLSVPTTIIEVGTTKVPSKIEAIILN